MRERNRNLFLTVALVVCSIAVLPRVARAWDASERKNNKVFFRGAYSSLTQSRGNEVFTDTLSTAGTNGSKGGFSAAGGVVLGLMDPGALGDIASLAGEVFMEYSRFSNSVVRQTTSALLAGTNNSRVNVTELNVGLNPQLRFDSLGRFRPYVTPIGLAFLVASPPSNDSTYLDLGMNFGAGVDFEVWQWLSVGVDVRYTHGFEMNHTNTSYFSTGASVGLLF